MATLIKNIKSLLQVREETPKMVNGKAMTQLPHIENAFLIIDNEGNIEEYGTMDTCPQIHFDTEIDATGRFVFPAFVDSHTHLVYAGSREIEYIDKVKGLSYEEIAKRGGGILNSAKRLHDTSEESLYEQALSRINEIGSQGTCAVEIKSGYGLTLEDEVKMLRVIRRLKETTPLAIKSTFLGAHAFPAEYKNNTDGYVDLIIDKMLPRIAEEGLADFIDVFCDRGFFSVEQTDRILTAGAKYGLQPKIHANELARSGGIQIGVQHNALSVDHLEFVEQEELDVLLNSQTMPTVLPGASFFLGLRYAPARKMIDAGLPVAIASDFNPGSSPSGNMKFMASLALINQHLLPEEILNAVTINTAYAMGLHQTHGVVAKQRPANLIITKPMPSFAFFLYAHNTPLVERVFVGGKLL